MLNGLIEHSHWILIGIVAAILLLAFLPNLLDYRNIRIIRERCEVIGLSEVEIKIWRNHYGVSFSKDGQRYYAKCLVVKGIVEWKGNAPEQF